MTTKLLGKKSNGFRIFKTVLRIEDLTLNEKFLFQHIYTFRTWNKSKYMAVILLGLSERQVYRAFNNLVDKGYIFYDENNKCFRPTNKFQNRSKESFFILKDVYQSKLSLIETLVLSEVNNFSMKDRVCFKKASTMAEEFGVSIWTVERGINKLKNLDLIVEQVLNNKSGLGSHPEMLSNLTKVNLEKNKVFDFSLYSRNGNVIFERDNFFDSVNEELENIK